jgi:imidazolonepropionase-like amidohydrolase
VKFHANHPLSVPTATTRTIARGAATGVVAGAGNEGRSAMSDTLVLRDFTLIDGTGRGPVPAANVVVEDGHIVAVDQNRRWAGARVVEGRGRWLIPGLWDTHIHHVFSGGGFVWPEEFSEEQRRWSWRGCLRSGVTSVVSVGDDKEIILSARARETDGSLVAPRVFASGTIFTAPGGHPCSTILHGHAANFRDLAIEIDDPMDGRNCLSRLVTDDAVDLVKVIYSTIPGDVPRLAGSVLLALVEEAHQRGCPIVAHVSTPEEAADCVAAGVDGLEHMVFGEAEALDSVFVAAAQAGVLWTPTLCLFDKFAHDGEAQYVENYNPAGTVSTTVLESLQAPGAWWHEPDDGGGAPWALWVQAAGRAHALGVRLVLGTDAGNPVIFHGLAVHRELQLLVRAGLTPMQALSAATSVAATKVGVQATFGTIQAGKEADLVLLDADPLEDIANTRRISLVVKRGQLFDPADLVVP